MKKILLFVCFAIAASTMNAQGVRVVKTDGSTSDFHISEFKRIEFLEDLKAQKEVHNMYITSLGYVIEGEREKRDAVNIRLTDKEGKEILSADAGIRIRGNSTSTLEKTPWDIKFIEKQGVLGMPKDRRWVLLANYWDRTNLRNDVGLEIARRAKGMAWNPRSEYVQVYKDGKYIGLYLLCEKIKSAKNRVNITELTPTDIKEPEITGGYLLEFDYTQDETIYTTSKFRYDVKIKEPDEVTKEQSTYIINYLNTMEGVLKDASQVKAHGYEKYLDVNSFIDFWLVGEIVMNKDFNGPASCYMYKDRGGKLFAGPVWDLDLYTFSATIHNVNTFLLKDYCLYYGALFTDSQFKERAKERWKTLKASLEGENSILDYIDERSNMIREDVKADDAAYPKRKYGNKLAGDESLPFDDAVNSMKDFLTKRIAALDNLINKM